MRVHPETFLPRPAGHMDLADPIQPHAINHSVGVAMMVDRVAPDIMQIEQLKAASLFANAIHQADVVADLRIARQFGKIVSGVLKQERHTVALLNGGAAPGDELRRLHRRRHRQGYADVKRVRVLADGLETEMLAVPSERPQPLETIEHFEVGGVATMRGADRKLDAVGHDRQSAADVLRMLEPIGQQLERAAAPFPTQDFRCDLDKIHYAPAIDLERELLEIGKSNAECDQRRALFADLQRVDAEVRKIGPWIADQVDMQKRHATAAFATKNATDFGQNIMQGLHILVVGVELEGNGPCASRHSGSLS